MYLKTSPAFLNNNGELKVEMYYSTVEIRNVLLSI